MSEYKGQGTNIADLPAPTSTPQNQPQMQLPSYQGLPSQPSRQCQSQPTDPNAPAEQFPSYNDVLNNPQLMGESQQGGANKQPGPDNSESYNIVSTMQDMAASNAETFGLPSRDIPQMTHRHDVRANPTHIPKQNVQKYIHNQETPECMINNKRMEHNRQVTTDTIFEQMQLPVMVGILYFLFSLPVVNNWFLKTFKDSFYPDGDMKFAGFVIKSTVFASLYYGLTYAIQYNVLI